MRRHVAALILGSLLIAVGVLGSIFTPDTPTPAEDEAQLVAMVREMFDDVDAMGPGEINEAASRALFAKIEAQSVVLARLTGVAPDDSKAEAAYTAHLDAVLAKHDPKLLARSQTARAASKVTATKHALQQLVYVVQMFELEQGRRPTAAEWPRVILTGIGSMGPLLTDQGAELLTDQWGNAVHYQPRPGGFTMISNGPDGQLGTADDLTLAE